MRRLGGMLSGVRCKTVSGTSGHLAPFRGLLFAVCGLRILSTPHSPCPERDAAVSHVPRFTSDNTPKSGSMLLLRLVAFGILCAIFIAVIRRITD